MGPFLRLATLAVCFVPIDALAGYTPPYCGSVCRYEKANMLAGFIGGIALAGAIVVGLFYAAVFVSLLKGEDNKEDTLGSTALKIGTSFLVGGAAIVMTDGGALFGLFFIVLYFLCSYFFGRRR